jgi:hypothetical protein
MSGIILRRVIRAVVRYTMSIGECTMSVSFA